MEQACININELICVYQNQAGTVYQSDKLKCFYIDFGHQFAKYNCTSLQKLKNLIENINIEQILLDANQAYFELITFNGCDYMYLLSPLEILALKDLLQGAYTMFKLNHIINDCLYRIAA